MDNFYTSSNITQELAQQQIYTVGTTKSNANGFPNELKNVTLPKGEYVATILCTLF
uniref:PiggyBac transposable element-derived protein domain-containing protein n=1 Tax=Amphimedon queenslandica TaxID=400682 RepID=A0A1X7U9S3_AMPQE